MKRRRLRESMRGPTGNRQMITVVADPLDETALELKRVSAVRVEVIDAHRSQIIELARTRPDEIVLVRQVDQGAARGTTQGDPSGYTVTTTSDASVASNLDDGDAFEMAIEKSRAPFRVLVVDQDGAAFFEFSTLSKSAIRGHGVISTAGDGSATMEEALFRLTHVPPLEGWGERDDAAFAAYQAEQLRQLKQERLVPADFEPSALARLRARLAIRG